jgi:hypothetical protein
VSKLSVSALQQHPNSARPFLFYFTCFLLCFVQLTMAGPTHDDEHTPPQSPRTKGIVQALVREVKKHTEGIDADVQVTNERIGVFQATQLTTDTKLGTMEASVARIDNSLAALLRRFDDLMTREHTGIKGITTTTMMNMSMTIGMSILLIQNLMTTTLAVRYSIIAMAGMAIDDVTYAAMTMLFINSSLKYHLLMANMILMLIFLENWLLNKNLHALNFLKMLGLEQPLVNSLILLLFGRWNMARNIPMTYHKLGLL